MFGSMPTMDDVRRALLAHRPSLVSAETARRAAVAMVLRDDAGPVEVLFIERASREGDPWSGHMAFPGGRVEELDDTTRAAAERETHEEVGLSLEGAETLGRLDDMHGLPATATQLAVSAFVFYVSQPGTLIPNHEVREAFWFPLDSLLRPERFVEHPMQRGSRTHFPGILVGEPGRHVVWGLTYRFLEGFLELLGQPLPERWQADPPS
jgi:8-oxo-dGTP pyrophosphatase MutT (NUDIX family)